MIVKTRINNRINLSYMKYVKGPGTKKTPKKTEEKKEDDGYSEQLVSKHIVNEQDQDQITNNPEEGNSDGESEPDRKPDFPKDLN